MGRTRIPPQYLPGSSNFQVFIGHFMWFHLGLEAWTGGHLRNWLHGFLVNYAYNKNMQKLPWICLIATEWSDKRPFFQHFFQPFLYFSLNIQFECILKSLKKEEENSPIFVQKIVLEGKIRLLFRQKKMAVPILRKLIETTPYNFLKVMKKICSSHFVN